MTIKKQKTYRAKINQEWHPLKWQERRSENRYHHQSRERTKTRIGSVYRQNTSGFESYSPLNADQLKHQRQNHLVTNTDTWIRKKKEIAKNTKINKRSIWNLPKINIIHQGAKQVRQRSKHSAPLIRKNVWKPIFLLEMAWNGLKSTLGVWKKVKSKKSKFFFLLQLPGFEPTIPMYLAESIGWKTVSNQSDRGRLYGWISTVSSVNLSTFLCQNFSKLLILTERPKHKKVEVFWLISGKRAIKSHRKNILSNQLSPFTTSLDGK